MFNAAAYPQLIVQQAEDDVTLGGSLTTVDKDVKTILTSGTAIGLSLNTAKCEIITRSNVPSGLAVSDFCRVSPEESVLLGAPLLCDSALDAALSSRCSELNTAEGRLSLISAHDALLLLKSSLSTPKLLHLLRSSPCTGHSALSIIDDSLRRCVSHITNCNLTDDQWAQASLPVKAGGLGVRRATHLAPSAYLAAYSATSELQARILDAPDVTMCQYEIAALEAWSDLSSTGALPDPSAFKQHNWDKPVVDVERDRLLAIPGYRSRLLAVSADHSSDWLHALPISSCGLRLSDEAIRVAVGLRLGCTLCTPHQCPCGSQVDSLGTHGLSCKKSGARIQRHNALNDIIHRGLVRAGVPSTKEPSGLLRSDGKRPDGVTQIPWTSGKCMAWDVTVVDTLAPSYASLSSISAGKAAERAAEKKVSKYSSIIQTHVFVPLAIETLGPVNSSALSFLSQLGRRLAAASGDPRETSFLFQRLSMTVQRFNCVAFHDSFVAPSNNAEDQ